MSHSNLVDYVRISPNSSNPRNKKIDAIVIHHMAGNLTVERCGEVFAATSRQASSNYGIGTDGRIACYVEEENRAWTTGSREIDNRAITFEVANCSGAPDWKVSDQALEATIALCVDICKRYGFKLNYTGDKSGNLHMHKWYQNTACPGPYLGAKFAYIAEEVNRRLNGGEVAEETKKPATEAAAKEHVPTVKEWQLAALADGYEFRKYGADGVWGAECESVACKAVVKKRLFYTNKNLTKLVQKVVGVTADGLCGKNTDAAIRAYQKKHGLTVDGCAGLATYKCMLNIK